jgi:hypothetical protein
MLRVLKGVAIIGLLGIGVILYADLQSFHLFHRITQVEIAKSRNSEERAFLIAEKARQDREVSFQKGWRVGALAVDALAIIWLASRLFRPGKPKYLGGAHASRSARSGQAGAGTGS